MLVGMMVLERRGSMLKIILGNNMSSKAVVSQGILVTKWRRSIRRTCSLGFWVSKLTDSIWVGA